MTYIKGKFNSNYTKLRHANYMKPDHFYHKNFRHSNYVAPHHSGCSNPRPVGHTDDRPGTRPTNHSESLAEDLSSTCAGNSPTNNTVTRHANYGADLADFEEIYQMAVDNGQLNIALKAKELILKHSDAEAEEPQSVAAFVRGLSPAELLKLADIVHKKFCRIQPEVEQQAHEKASENEPKKEPAKPKKPPQKQQQPKKNRYKKTTKQYRKKIPKFKKRYKRWRDRQDSNLRHRD